MEDLRSIPVVPLKFLFDSVLPPLPDALNFKKLQVDLHSKKLVRENGWRGFKSPPKDSKGHESRVFRPLVKMFNEIVVEVVSQDKTSSPALRMQRSPDSAPFSKRVNSSKPDGFLELLERKSVDNDVGTSNWEDIPVSMEFKKFESAADVHDVGLMLVHLCLLIILCAFPESSQDHLEPTPHDAK